MGRNYWGYRIDTNKIEFFSNELAQGRLRQGWGYLEGQDLRKLTTDEGAKRNLSMFRKVKKNDILLVPNLPAWGCVAIVEATEDWEIGYRFDIIKEIGDYGHIFPARYIKHFLRSNEYVTGTIRATLKNLLRFWNIGHCGKDIEELLKMESSALETEQSYEDRFDNSIESAFYAVFDEKKFSDELYNELTKQFTSAEWETALVRGLKRIFPSYIIEKVGGASESEHGTDILMKIPGIIPNFQYCIAIQVKDYEGFVASDVIGQINKADKYWNSDLNAMKLIEKIVIVTRAEKDDNKQLLDNESGVRFIFSSGLKELLTDIGKAFVGINGI